MNNEAIYWLASQIESHNQRRQLPWVSQEELREEAKSILETSETIKEKVSRALNLKELSNILEGAVIGEYYSIETEIQHYLDRAPRRLPNWLRKTLERCFQ